MVTSWNAILGYGYVRVIDDEEANKGLQLPHLLTPQWHHQRPWSNVQSIPVWLVTRRMVCLPTTQRLCEVKVDVGQVCNVTFVCNETNGGGYLVEKVQLVDGSMPSTATPASASSRTGFTRSAQFRRRR